MVLFTIAELIEARSLERARIASKGQMQLAPDLATVRQPDPSWQEVDAKSVPVGALIRIKPGERIGFDGAIFTGRSTVDQAPITGASLPVDKMEGDPVIAGTINGAGSFAYQISAAAHNTTFRTHHPCSRSGPGKQGSNAAFCRPVRPGLHAGRARRWLAPPSALRWAPWGRIRRSRRRMWR